ncbi:DNA-processing protein DprA [Corynebacteriaceae bacterium 6-324]
MSTLASRKEQTADILRLLRADLGMSQTERVNELLRLRNAQRVLLDNTSTLFASRTAEEEELDSWHSSGFNSVNVLEEEYPELLLGVREAPGILYWQGTLNPSELGVSIVGSRAADSAVLRITREFAAMLATEGIPVISGLAKGIDTAAHEGALSVGGRTIAVMGTGLDKTYPAENKHLREDIQANQGLVMTQFEPYSDTHRFNFPMRNAVMSGYGLATVVMAATEKSGTRHQVKAAVKHGRKVIFTGRVANYVKWANELVMQGKAVSVTSLEHAVDVAQSVIDERNSQTMLF